MTTTDETEVTLRLPAWAIAETIDLLEDSDVEHAGVLHGEFIDALKEQRMRLVHKGDQLQAEIEEIEEEGRDG